MFVAATGVKEGTLQVHASFKPVVYDGEDCLQVILKDSFSLGESETPAATEGLGYPLFITHLDNFITEANTAGSVVGHVVHIGANGLQHYLADKRFGSLNGKIKALASELKSTLHSNDFMIRFTENSFLMLPKTNAGQDSQPAKEKVSAEHPAIARYVELLNKFERSLNKEIGHTETNPLISFSYDVIPVDPDSGSAEKLIRAFLMSGSDKDSGMRSESVDNNVVPFAKKIDEQPSQDQPVSKSGSQHLHGGKGKKGSS